MCESRLVSASSLFAEANAWHQYRDQGILFQTPMVQATLMTVFSQYYAAASCTILFYDYLLTLPDEVCSKIVL